MGEDRFGGGFDETRRNATLGWIVVLVLCGLALRYALEGSYRWFAFTGLAIAIVLAPAAVFRDPLVLPPWELLALVAIPVLDASMYGQSFLTTITTYLAVAAVALVVAVEIDRFTPARMNRPFAVGLVVIATLAVAATWNVAQWVADAALDTAYIAGGNSQDAANREMMFDFVYATVAGLLAGIVFERYFRGRSLTRTGHAGTTTDGAEADDGSDDETAPETESAPPFTHDRFDLPESRLRQLSRVLQAALGVVLLYGLVTLDLTTVANAGIALALTFLPAVLERDYQLPLEPELVCWLTAAVFLHAIGSAGLYDLLGPWDNMTHALSASIVAAAGYVVVRAIDLHTDEVYLPPKLLFTFILLFVLAFGVVWELLEFAIDSTAQWFGLESAVLAQHGIDDTIVDLLFDLVGAVVVAIWGSVYLSEVSQDLVERFDGGA